MSPTGQLNSVSRFEKSSALTATASKQFNTGTLFIKNVNFLGQNLREGPRKWDSFWPVITISAHRHRYGLAQVPTPGLSSLNSSKKAVKLAKLRPLQLSGETGNCKYCKTDGLLEQWKLGRGSAQWWQCFVPLTIHWRIEGSNHRTWDCHWIWDSYVAASDPVIIVVNFSNVFLNFPFLTVLLENTPL